MQYQIRVIQVIQVKYQLISKVKEKLIFKF